MNDYLARVSTFVKSSGFRKYFANTSWLFLERVFRMGTALVIGIYVARYLKPEDFGLLQYAKGFVGIFAVFVSLGLDSIIVRDLVRYPEKKHALLGTTFALKFIGVLMMIAVILGYSLLGRHDSLTNTLVLIIATSELFNAFKVIEYYYQSRVESKFIVRIQVLQMILTSAIKLGLIFMGAPLIWFAVMVVFDTLFTAAGFVYTYVVSGKQKLGKWAFDRKLALVLLKESWPLVFYGLALNIQAKIDQVMIGDMLGNFDVGQYSVALKMIESVGFVPMVVLSSFAPAVTRAKEKSHEKYRERLLNLYKLFFLLFLVVAIPLYFIAEPIIVLLYGQEYQPAGVLLSLFAIRLFFTNMGVAKQAFITNESLFTYSLFTAIVGATINVITNYFLIPFMGPEGAIIATIVSFTVSIFLLDLFFPKMRENLLLMIKGIATFWNLKGIR
ncbi:MAG: flippase [Bacteroidota bacterium]